MVAGILGFKNDSTSGDKVVYIVPTGKIAVVNIFASADNGISIGGAAGMGSTEAVISASSGAATHTQHKGIVLQAGAYVKFSELVTGIVTGFEEDA